MTRDKLIEELGEYLLAPSATKNTCQECYDACEKCEDKMVEFVRQAITQLKADAQEIDTLRGELEEARDLISEWKLSSGLVCGGDPDGITPAAAEDYWENVEVERDTLQKQNAELRDMLQEFLDALIEESKTGLEEARAKRCNLVVTTAWLEHVRQALTPQPNLPGDVIQPKGEPQKHHSWPPEERVKQIAQEVAQDITECHVSAQPKKEECDCWPEHDVWGDHKHEEDCSSLKAQPKKEECPECGGRGEIWYADRMGWDPCPKCGGNDD